MDLTFLVSTCIVLPKPIVKYILPVKIAVDALHKKATSP